MAKELVTVLDIFVYDFECEQVTDAFGNPLILRHIVEEMIGEDAILDGSKCYRTINPITDEEYRKYFMRSHRVPVENEGVRDFLNEPRNSEFVTKYVRSQDGLYTMDCSYSDLCLDKEKRMYFLDEFPIMIHPNLLHIMSYKTNCEMILREAIARALMDNYDISSIVVSKSLIATFDMFARDRKVKLELLERSQSK